MTIGGGSEPEKGFWLENREPSILLPDPTDELERFIERFTPIGYPSAGLQATYDHAVEQAAAIIPVDENNVDSKFIKELAKRFVVSDAQLNDPSEEYMKPEPGETKLLEALRELRRIVTILSLPRVAVSEALAGDSAEVVEFWDLIKSVDQEKFLTTLSGGSASFLKMARDFLVLASFDPFKQNLLPSYPLTKDSSMRLIDQRRLALAVAGKVLRDRSPHDKG